MWKSESKLFEKEGTKIDMFSPDGIVNEDAYKKSELKLIFVLKEVNHKNKKNDGSPFNLKTFLQEGAKKRRATWDNISRWVYGIRNLDNDIVWTDLNTSFFTTLKRKEILSSICVMNLKKSPGGYKTNNKEFRKAVRQERNASFFEMQFNLYNDEKSTRPNLIISCGGKMVSSLFIELVNSENTPIWQVTSRGIRYYEFDDNRYFIEYSHPEARVSDNLLYYGLIDAVKEILSSNQNRN